MKTSEQFKKEYWTLWCTYREGLFKAEYWYLAHGNEDKAKEMKERYESLSRYLRNLEKAITLAFWYNYKPVEL